MIDTSIFFHVFPRKVFGKKAKKLKNENYVLANLYGLNKPSLALQVTQDELRALVADGHDSGLIYAVNDETKEKIPVLVDEIVRHSITNAPQHVVLRRVDLKEEIETEVKIVTQGICEVADATPVVVKDSVLITTIPSKIPEFITIDVSTLTEEGQSILLSQLSLPEGVKLVIAEDADDEPVVVLQTTKVVEPVEPEPTESEEAVEGTETTGETAASTEENKDGESGESKTQVSEN